MKNCPKKFEIPESYVEFYSVKENFDFWFDIVKQACIRTLTNYRKNLKKIYGLCILKT